ncbi:hypothetical protein Chor_001234, partial [Crotalus horridus]
MLSLQLTGGKAGGVTLKNSRRRCLNLNGEQGRTIKE